MHQTNAISSKNPRKNNYSLQTFRHQCQENRVFKRQQCKIYRISDDIDDWINKFGMLIWKIAYFVGNLNEGIDIELITSDGST